MIKILENPKTYFYNNFKEHVLSFRFPLFYERESTRYEKEGYANIPFYTHDIIKRPELSHLTLPEPLDSYVEDATRVCKEILDHNSIEIKTFLRIAVNAVHPEKEVVKTVPHVDHRYDHKNLLVYLTSAGGKTFVGTENYDPVEDAIITFGGEEHYHETPISIRRVVLVATYI